MIPARRCPDCGSQLAPCPARWDGEETFVGFYPCPCDEARADDRDLEESRAWESWPLPESDEPL